ncbi:M20/M25/M40 family metallo-hydrolase [Pseudarthrobacter sp. J1738]|uniref:M20/M25/M40 family metallo-hydrolase n=1 Tax=Pseudarthrobacter sp. J1738 TaxID=3420446 RepID=UPI003D2E2B5D
MKPAPDSFLSGALYLPGQRAAASLSRLIQHPTVSSRNPDDHNPEVFESFLQTLCELYPLVHTQLELERVNQHGLLIRWAGSNPSGTYDGAIRATILMAHYDVVPAAEPETWTHPPFSGHNDGEHVWGRGTLDDKGALVAWLEAAEALIEQGFTPQNDVYFSFGNNEETAGDSAKAAVELLKARGISPWLVLDEGGAIATGVLSGIKSPAAMVGVAEKGIMDLQLTTRSPGGHASQPPRMGATARLARAIMRLEMQQFPVELPLATVSMFERLAPLAPKPMSLVFSRARKLRLALARILPLMGPESSALVRTTMAVTTLSGSAGANVLAATATANVNIRLALGQTVESALKRITTVIADPAVEMMVLEGSDPSPVSPDEGEAWEFLSGCISTVFPHVPAVPYVMLAATDSRRFTEICANVYRFAPFVMDTAARESIHGVDEKIGLKSLSDGVRFCETLLRRL